MIVNDITLKGSDEDWPDADAQRESVAGVNRRRTSQAYHFGAGGPKGICLVDSSRSATLQAKGLLDPERLL